MNVVDIFGISWENYANILCTYSFTHTLIGEELKVIRKIGLNLFYGFLPATGLIMSTTR